MLDPGGMLKGTNYQELLKERIFLLKPNEHEAQMLSGIEVRSQSDALRAAKEFLNIGIENVLITLGAEGALLVNRAGHIHVPIPSLKEGKTRDQTGCGDQAMAALCAGIVAGKSLEDAAHQAVVAGTLQFYKEGIVPVTSAELASGLSAVRTHSQTPHA
jgi:fructose-1-phosphate kinase PfkB-like protein